MPAGQRVAIVIILGVVCGVAGAVGWATAGALALVAVSVAILIVPGRGRGRVVTAALFFAGAVDGASARDRTLASPLEDWLAARTASPRPADAVVVEATLAEDAQMADEAARLVLDVRRLRDGGQWMDLRGRVQAHVSGALALAQVGTWTAGRTIRASMTLRPLDILQNPGSPSETWQRLRRSCDLIGSVKSAALVSVERPGPWWDEWAAGVRRRVRAAAARYVSLHSAQSGAIVVAILIGDRLGLSDEVQRRLQAAGTYHVIAISGGNVALLTTLCFLGVRLVVRSARVGTIVTMAVVLAYGWIVGGGSSVDRAVAGACLYLAAGLVGLVPSAANSLGVVATVLVVVDPLTSVDVGAWLSFGASLSIVLCAQRFAAWAHGPYGARPRDPDTGSAAPVPAWITLWRMVVGLFSATLAAEVALAPVSAAVFSRVGTAGLVLNFAAIPAMSVVEVAGLATVALSGWWAAGAALAGRVSSWAATFLVASSSVVDTPSGLSWRVPPVSLAWTIAFYGSAALFLWWRDWRRPRIAAGVVALASLAVIVTGPGVESARPPAGWLRLTILDVGQGDAELVQFPTGQSLLVDAGGSAGSFDIGGRVVTPALWALGVRRLDYLAFTHPDLDHIGGVRSVARDLAPREIWEGAPVPSNAARRALTADAQARGIVWRQLSSGDRFEVGSVEVAVMNPPMPEWERQRTRNEDSVVLRIRFADVEILLTGDAGQEFERRLSADARAVPLRLLKVGHHGSRSSSTAAFVQAFSPQLAFISVGRSNLFGHPAPDVLARYEAADTQLFRTDRDGAVLIETDGRDARVRTMRGQTFTAMVR